MSPTRSHSHAQAEPIQAGARPDQVDTANEPLPQVTIRAPDYGAQLPLWGEGFGNIAWQHTKFSPALLDRLAAWQREFDTHHHGDRGWDSDQIRDRWARHAENLAADVRAELGTRASLVVRLRGRGS